MSSATDEAVAAYADAVSARRTAGAAFDEAQLALLAAKDKEAQAERALLKHARGDYAPEPFMTLEVQPIVGDVPPLGGFRIVG